MRRDERRLPGWKPATTSLHLLLELDVPVGDVEEVLPFLVAVIVEHEADHRAPLRADRLADQAHVRLVRETVRLAGIALDARAHDIFPRGLAAVVPGDDVVEIQFLARENVAAVLALVV